jgi:hypothetical protein
MYNSHETLKFFAESELIPSYSPIKPDFITTYYGNDGNLYKVLFSFSEGVSIFMPVLEDGQLNFSHISSSTAPVHYRSCKLEGDIIMLLDDHYGWVPVLKEIQDKYNDSIAEKFLTDDQ